MTNTRNNRTQAVLAYAPRLVTSTGLVTIAVDTASDGALLEIDNGVTLQGLKITDGGGTEVNSLSSHRELSVYVRTRSGSTGTVAHLNGSMSAAHKIRVVGGSDLTVTADSWVQLVYSVTEGRWLAYSVAAAVQSVNGETGAVVLDAADVGADPSGTAATAVSNHVAASNPHTQYARVATYSGQTSGSGTYTVVFGAAYSSTPNVKADIIGGTAYQCAKVTSRSTTGFTVTAYTEETVNVPLIGLVVTTGTRTATNGLTIDVTVTSNG